MAQSGRGSGKDASQEAFDVVQEMSQLLNTTLDARALHLCIRLLEHGADPRALAEVVRTLQVSQSSDRQSRQTRS